MNANDQSKLLFAAAVHEAGHAVVANYLGEVVHTVKLTNRDAGKCNYTAATDIRDAAILLAGQVAELCEPRARVGLRYPLLLKFDHERLAELNLDADEYERAADKAFDLVRVHRQRINRVARELVRRRTLTGPQVVAIIEEETAVDTR